MCLAICNFKNQPLTETEVKNAWENNSDGAGILYKQHGVLKIYHQMTDVDKFYTKYTEVIKLSNCLVHFRVGNKGSKTRGNTHPFFINKNLGFIHNGTITTMPKDGEKSDTKVFNEILLKGLARVKPTFYKSPEMLWLISEATGNSKIAFMDIDEEFSIAGEDKGEAFWDEKSGNWFSNKSHEEVSRYECYGGYRRLKKEHYPAPSVTKYHQDTSVSSFTKEPLSFPPSEGYSCDIMDGFEDDGEFIPNIPNSGTKKEESPFLQDVLPVVDEDSDVIDEFNADVYAAFIAEVIDVLAQVPVDLMNRWHYADEVNRMPLTNVLSCTVVLRGGYCTVQQALFNVRNDYDQWDLTSENIVNNYLATCQ